MNPGPAASANSFEFGSVHVYSWRGHETICHRYRQRPSQTGIFARVTNFLFESHANIETLDEQVTRGQFQHDAASLVACGHQLEARVLVKADKFYLGTGSAVYWGVVWEV